MITDPKKDHGLDPEAAASEIRTILAAGGQGQGIIAQRRALLFWSEACARKFGAGFDLSLARVGGLEHLVWVNEPARMVRKMTYGGSFGRTVRDLRQGLVPATPLEYLDRWGLHNSLFGAITRVSGVRQSGNEDLALVIEQDALPGDLPSLEIVQEFMHQAGFAKVPDQLFAWVNPDLRIAAFDARPANFVLIEGTPVPFDLVLVPLNIISGLH